MTASARAKPPAPLLSIVGIGASAGGLEALSQLVSHLDLDSTAFVVIQHLSPRHESTLTHLLSKSSTIEVVTATDGARVEANKVYVIPPNANLALLRGRLQLLPVAPGRGPRLPIDLFFRSLAEDQGQRAIGVILSGTGSDGTQGLKAIKQAGGISFAQTPATAKFDGMPRSAIESGWADLVLPPKEIAEELMRIGQHPYLSRATRRTNFQPELIDKLLVLIRDTSGNDLTHYKRATIERRVERRLVFHKLERFSDYLDFVQAHPAELGALYKDLLIGVTSFFRDPAVFEALKLKVFPRILENKPAGSALRFWVPACSTGEEVYSLAIALLELLEERAAEYRIQFFATDVDEQSLQIARRGVYLPGVALDVSAERLERFFTAQENEFRIARRVRDLVVFSNQNVVKDAPFSKLDLVSCRNLLIYLQPILQRRVMQMLHYSLRPGAFLVLGTSETVGESPELFSLVDRTHKFYAAKRVRLGGSLEVPLGAASAERPQRQLPPQPPTRGMTTVTSLADRKILELYGPPGVLVNETLEVLQFRGQTGPYLAPSPGLASLNVLRLARPELHLELRRLLHEALSKNRRVEGPGGIHEGGLRRELRLEVVPLVDPESGARCLLVLFHEAKAPRSSEPQVSPVVGLDAATSPGIERRLAEVEHDLSVTKEFLQTSIEDLESANEELKVSNEELQSSNEELQSTNEELETSKEELQSSNEELTTVNDELHHRMQELQEIHDDLQVVLHGVESAVVVVGTDLRLRRFTTSAEGLLSLVPSDVGRAVSLLNAFLPGEQLEVSCAGVLKGEVPIAREVLGGDKRRYLLRVAPYRAGRSAIAGVILLLSLLEGAVGDWTAQRNPKG